MNTSKLVEIVKKIKAAENKFATQGQLQNLSNQMNNLVSQPQSPDHQMHVSEALKKLRDSIRNFQSEFTPQELDKVYEIISEQICIGIYSEIEQSIQENAMTPNVAQELINNLFTEREETIEKLDELNDSLAFFDFEYEETVEGTTEVGFQIPRELFDNDFEGLLEELKDIRNIVRFFSVVATGEHQKIEVGNISTTDPLVFLLMAKPIGIALGSTITWGIGVWYTVERIRKLRAETAQIEEFTAKEVEDFYGKKIKDTIASEVDNKVKSLLAEGKAPKASQGELGGQLKWALNALLAKMERGMTVELRIEPPKEFADDEVNEDEKVNYTNEYSKLQDIQSQLVFPERSEDPVLSIPVLKGEKNEKK